jgi:hypothetical protein
MCLNIAKEVSAPPSGKRTLKVVAENVSETSLLIHQTTRCHLTENCHLGAHHAVELSPHTWRYISHCYISLHSTIKHRANPHQHNSHIKQHICLETWHALLKLFLYSAVPYGRTVREGAILSDIRGAKLEADSSTLVLRLAMHMAVFLRHFLCGS